jgi:hypothetical protein
LLGGITEFTTGADVTLLELLETLQAMPQLQTLRVQHCCAVWDKDIAGAEGAPLHIVTLLHLQLITFRDTTPCRFVFLIPHIDTPPMVCRHLFWHSWVVVRCTYFYFSNQGMILSAIATIDPCKQQGDDDLNRSSTASSAVSPCQSYDFAFSIPSSMPDHTLFNSTISK